MPEIVPQPEWITHHEAAALMRASGFVVNEKRLRTRLLDGTYTNFPELERRREGRTVTLSRTQVEEWIADRAAKAAALTKPKVYAAHAFAEVEEMCAQHGYSGTLQTLRRLGLI